MVNINITISGETLEELEAEVYNLWLSLTSTHNLVYQKEQIANENTHKKENLT
jgi:hypothetical protein